MLKTNNSNISNNKRIVKNTLFMYFRMMLMMLVGLYTSRVVLIILGINDFGIYNIVGGMVVLFSFINNAIVSSTQRHLSYELGKPNGDVTKVFSACFNIHVFIAVVIFCLSETIGLWFLNTQMNIPSNRMTAANWCFQFSVILCLANIIRAPHNAIIISYERMSFYAYISIFEAILKLLIVYVLSILYVDKLIMFSILMFSVTALTNVLYWIYCSRNIKTAHIVTVKNRDMYKELLSFSSWAFLGSMANVGLQQGINLIINIFFGVALNAAVGIANQINSAVSQFVMGFQQALNPQLIQTEASKDHSRQQDLICKSSKFSFFIMLIVSSPLMINLPYVLSFWLGSYPSHSVSICNLILIGVLISCLSGPLWVSIYATGNIKAYQITVSCVALSILPIIYIGGKLGMSPEHMFLIRTLSFTLVIAVQLYFCRQYISLSIKLFLNNVIKPIIIVTGLFIIFYYIMRQYIPEATTFIELIEQTILYVSFLGCSICFIGINVDERNFLFKIISNKFK